VFDMLTLDQLRTLHTQLADQHTAIHNQMLGIDGKPIVPPLSDEWRILAAKADEIHEAAEAVYAEIAQRRDA